MSTQIDRLKQELKTLLVQSTAICVETLLAQVRQLASTPTRFRGPSAILAALRKLADHARVTTNEKVAECEATLRQIRPSMYSPQLGDIV